MARCGRLMLSAQSYAKAFDAVTLSCGEVLWFHARGAVLWIDANHWGNNRCTHLAPLETLGVQWGEH
jgi:hypothetical protein